MPAVIHPGRIERTARELAWGVLGARDGDVRTLLHTTLNRLQADAYRWTEDAPAPDLQFEADDGLSEAVLRRIMVVDELPFDWRYAADERNAYRESARCALRTLEKADAEMYGSLNKVVAVLMFGRLGGFGGGTNSSAIGCVWLSPKPTWSVLDWVENIFHEYIHNCLFLDDMRHGLFQFDGEVLARDDALVQSAILKTGRPYDRAFHSCFVSFGLMQLDSVLGVPARFQPFIEPLSVSIAALHAKEHFLTPHGREVLGTLVDAFDAFKSTLA